MNCHCLRPHPSAQSQPYRIIQMVLHEPWDPHITVAENSELDQSPGPLGVKENDWRLDVLPHSFPDGGEIWRLFFICSAPHCPARPSERDWSLLGRMLHSNDWTCSGQSQIAFLIFMIRIWQEAKFKAMLRNYLSSIISEQLGKIEFNLLLQQAHIRFQSDNDALSYQAWFKRDATISKEVLIESMKLEKNVVANCQEYFIISMRIKNHYRSHSQAKCISFFKALMEEKYGNLFEWFGGLNQNRDIRKVHSGAFRENVRDLLSNTPHEECSCLIANCFAKNRKNQITIETFKNTMVGLNKRERYRQSRLSLGNISQKGGTERKEVRCSSLVSDRKSLSLVGMRPSPSPALRTFNRKRISLIK